MKISHSLLVAAIGGIALGATACGGSMPSAPGVTDPSAAMPSTPSAPSAAMPATPGATSATPAAKHACKGKNDCKGQGGCKTDKNSCKGQNACKGQGGCKTA